MKRNGFTLAEVLITLSIIGVVAALTLPNLQADVVQRQIGPKLAKAVASFEQANEALLNDKMADSLIDAEVISSSGNANSYASQLTNFLKGSDSSNSITTKDGITFTISGKKSDGFSSSSSWTEANFTSNLTSSEHPHNNLIGSVRIDINGTNNLPNAAGEDIFFFTLFDDGSLRPVGSENWAAATATSYTGNCDKTHNSNLSHCAGYVFGNNLKADYKLD